MFSPDTPLIKRRRYQHFQSPLGKRKIGYSAEPRNVRARTFEEDIPVTTEKMPYGKSGSDWSAGRKSVVTMSKDTLRKRIAKEEDFYITRMVKMNEFDSGVGHNKLEFNQTTGRLPVWLCDLTDYDNVSAMSGVYSGTSDYERDYVVSHVARPWYVLNFKQGAVTHDITPTNVSEIDLDAYKDLHEERLALYFDKLDYRYEMEMSTVPSAVNIDPATGAVTVGTRFDPTKIETSTNKTLVQKISNQQFGTANTHGSNSGKLPMLKWVDFRGMFYGVKSREVEWTLSVVQFAKDYLDPIPNDYLQAGGAAGGEAKVRDRFQFWYQTAKKLTAHPMLPRMADYDGEKGLRYLAKYKFKIREALNDADQINKVEKRINLRLNKILRKRWKFDASKQNAYNVSDVYTSNKGLDNPMDKNAVNYLESSRIHPRSRVYLMISATCPKSDLENADKVTNVYNGAVLDPTKVRNVTYEVPFKYTDAGFNNSSWIGGTNDVSATIDPATIKLPGENGLAGLSSVTNYVQQIDDADLVANSGKNALRTDTSGADSYVDNRGRLHIGANLLRAPDGTDTTGTITQLARYTEVVDDPGRDNPTFDFIMRMKYVI